MRLLLDIDTNIFLEVLNSEEARELMNKGERHDFFISDFTFHSIGLLLFRRKQYDTYRQFLNDMIFTAGVKIISLSPYDTESVINSAQKFNLDFDDAYQYAVASSRDMQLMSFDRDFDRTELGRKEPSDF